jgi:asparagine synthase (glutamine-hydrolysing)
VHNSVRAHLRSDVPWCSLLSGGLDSAAVAREAVEAAGSLTTFASGHPAAQGEPDADLEWAARVGEQLGTTHVPAPVNRSMFLQRWPEMINTLGVPLSTPNEVAINEVARALRQRGRIVTLSGEGADELFGGDETPLAAAAEFINNPDQHSSPGAFRYDSAAWISRDIKARAMRPEVWDALQHDAAAVHAYDRMFQALSNGENTLQAHLAFLRRVNLEGLLQRLDTATMLASVEGRTPYADVVVALAAEAIPIAQRFVPATLQQPAKTKQCLRNAYADLPLGVAQRPKASFPLPFQAWLAHSDTSNGAGTLPPTAELLCASPLINAFFTPEAVDLVAEAPGDRWHLAWPMLNLALWSQRWWG